MSRPRREARLAHAYKAQHAHTHVVRARREPERVVSVRCTRPDCRKPKGEQA